MSRASLASLALAVVLAVFVLLSFAGCRAGLGRAQIAAQAPGTVSGAGVAFTGPTNSAQPSRVSGKRTVTRYEWPRFDLDYFAAGVAPTKPTSSATAQPAAIRPADTPPPTMPPSVTPVVEHEEFSAEIGAHQDLAGILKQAAKLVSEWGWLRIVGVLVILGGVGFAVWSMGNPGGYTVVGWGFAACGVVFLFAAGNPAWLLLLCLPFGFYVAQKLNLVRLPGDSS